MLRKAILHVILFAGLSALQFKGMHFNTIPISDDITCPILDDELDEIQRATVQIHWNKTIPADDGGNFGDREVYPVETWVDNCISETLL